jgi:hypothetical protein
LLELGQRQEAGELARRVIAASQRHHLPALSVYGHQLLGDLASRQSDPAQALEHYDAAIRLLEQLRGRLMVQYRSSFLADKQSVYEEAVGACLALGRPAQGFEYAERAKSRSLLDMLAFKLDLGLTARHADDQPLIDELKRLRQERDRLYRRSVDLLMPASPDPSLAEAGPGIPAEALAQETRITSLWHRLLIRNADYAREASLWAVHVEPVQPYLGPDTALVEYFVVRGRMLAFVVSSDGLSAHPLPADLGDLRQWLQFLWHNFQMVPGSDPAHVHQLEGAARGLLERFYRVLVAPMIDTLGRYRRWIVVPHGPLHYLPFHALYDGRAYLLEQAAISYLPAAGFLRYASEARPAGSGWVSVGHSFGGRLPNALYEAQSIADLAGVQPLLEGAATLAACRAAITACRALHLAAHGEFRADNPLFSGLALADGWLSLVLSQWSVEDETTARLMLKFYRDLKAGRSKGEALRDAQLAILYQGGARLEHPYFWAPFFLVGDTGPL